MRDGAVLRIAQVGVGGMGRAHVRAAMANPRAEVVALCDVSGEALEAARDGHDIPCFRNLDSMLGAVDCDALVAVLPHHLYPDALAAAARLGLAILKEKPFARNLTDGMAMQNAVSTAGVPFLCAAQRRYGTPFRKAQELLDAGACGDVFLVRGLITYPWRLGGGWGWRGVRAQSGGIALVDSGWHSLDAIVAFKGLPSSVYCRVGGMSAGVAQDQVDDKAIAVFEFPDGAIGSLTACFQTVPSRFEVALHGTEATLEVDAQGLTLYPRQGGQPKRFEDDGVDPIAAQLDHFLDVALLGVAPRVGIDQALAMQRVVEAGYESAATGRAVELLW